MFLPVCTLPNSTHGPSFKFHMSSCQRFCKFDDDVLIWVNRSRVIEVIKLFYFHFQLKFTRCPLCPSKAFTKDDLLRHIAVHHRDNTCSVVFSCFLCQKLFDSYDAVTAHITLNHGKYFNSSFLHIVCTSTMIYLSASFNLFTQALLIRQFLIW